jgi:hypothetical protein
MDNNFIALNDKNEKIKCEILHTFKHNNDNFIFYSDGTLNENNELNVLANKYITNNNELNLLPINDDEWDIVDKEWSKIND